MADQDRPMAETDAGVEAPEREPTPETWKLAGAIASIAKLGLCEERSLLTRAIARAITTSKVTIAPDPEAEQRVAAIRERQTRRAQCQAQNGEKPERDQAWADIQYLLAILDSRPIAQQRIALSGKCDNAAHSVCPYPDRCICECHGVDET